MNRFKTTSTNVLDRFIMGVNRFILSSEPVHAFELYLCPESEPVQTPTLWLWTGSKHLLNRFNKNLFWCVILILAEFVLILAKFAKHAWQLRGLNPIRSTLLISSAFLWSESDGVTGQNFEVPVATTGTWENWLQSAINWHLLFGKTRGGAP